MSLTPRESLDAEYREKIAAAETAIKSRREAAFIDVPFLLCGLTIRPMCLPDYLALIVCGNAHVNGLQPSPESSPEDCAQFWAVHNAQFVWALSPEFAPDNQAGFKAVMKQLGRKSHQAVCAELDEYLQDTFADAPTPSRAVGGAEQADPFRVSFAATWYHRIASAYGWSRAEIRSTPLRELFQLLRVIAASDALKHGSFPGGVADETDRLWAEYLQKQTALAAVQAV